MKYSRTAIVRVVLLFCVHCHVAPEKPVHNVDVCVYGGTASGVMAAVAAAKEGRM